MPLNYLFVDMNAYFASVEQQDRTCLRHRPVAVVPVMTDHTCCIATSYEAKQYGVHTGTMAGQARRLCPQIRLVSSRPRRYVEYHHRIVAAVESCLHISAVHSVDEMSCRLLGQEHNCEQAEKLARKVKAALRRQVGRYLRCSIGLGSNVWLAKVAADMHKPDGLVVISRRQLPQRLYGLELMDLPGIGQRMQRRLARHGVQTVEQLCELSPDQLAGVWGSRVLARQWWHQLRGEDLPAAQTRRHTVGHSHVLPPSLRSDSGAYTVLVRLIHKAAQRMRHLGYRAQSVWVHVSFLDGPKWKLHRALAPPCADTLSLLRTFHRMWRHKPGGCPLKVSVTLCDLTPGEGATAALFDGEHRLDHLARTMDRINRRFGPNAVYFAAMHGVRRHAPMRIAFGHVPDLDLPSVFEDDPPTATSGSG